MKRWPHEFTPEQERHEAMALTMGAALVRALRFALATPEQARAMTANGWAPDKAERWARYRRLARASLTVWAACGFDMAGHR